MVPSKRILPFGNLVEHRFGFPGKCSGCKDRPYRNFTTAVAKGKRIAAGMKVPVRNPGISPGVFIDKNLNLN